MNILITGGSGFLGSRLAKTLSPKNTIKIISRGVKSGYLSSEELNTYNFEQVDLRDRRSIGDILRRDIDLVIHCAAVIDTHSETRCSPELLDANLSATINLLESMIEKGLKNLLFCSSMTVYGLNNKIPVKEDGILDPVHFYGLTKKWAEEAVLRYSRAGLIRSLVLRFPGLYGFPRREGYIFNITKRFIGNEDVQIDTRGLKFWEAINVDDAAAITEDILKAWKWKQDHHVLNCSYGKETDFIDTAYRIRKLLGSRSKITVKKPIDYCRFYLDNSRLKKLIRFDYGFEDSLARFLKDNKGWLGE